VPSDPAVSAENSPRAAIVQALEVRHYGRLALATGAVVTLAVTLLFVGGLAGGRTDEPLWLYVALAFVVFTTTALLAAVVLVGRRVLRLAVHPAAIVRRAATGGLLAGGLWLLGALGLALGPGPPWAPVVDVAVPWAALLTPLGLWAVYTRSKRSARAPPAVAAATLLASLAALLLADLAAFELVALLPDVGRAVDPGIARLFAVGVVGLVGGQTGIALLAVAGADVAGTHRVPAFLALPALVGLVVYLVLAPVRIGLVALAAGLGLAWAGACWDLRGVTDAEVPTGPDPWADEPR